MSQWDNLCNNYEIRHLMAKAFMYDDKAWNVQGVEVGVLMS